MNDRDALIERDRLGRVVREAWVKWALTQPNPKPTWLAPYDELSEPDKEADRQIGEAVRRDALMIVLTLASPSPAQTSDREAGEWVNRGEGWEWTSPAQWPEDVVSDAIVAAYIAGATAVQENYQPLREGEDPEFGEAASDYAVDALAKYQGEG